MSAWSSAEPMTRSGTMSQAIAINPKDFNGFNSRGKAFGRQA